MPKQPTADTIRQMLDDVQVIVADRYAKSPDPTCGCFYMPLPPGGKHGVPFAELTHNDQADLLQSYIRWEDFKAKGVTTAQVLSIWQNVQLGKPRDQWLEGTGLDARQSLRELFAEWREDAKLAEAERVQRERLEKQLGPREIDQAQEKPKEKDRGMER